MGNISDKKEKKHDLKQREDRSQSKQKGSPSMSRQDAGKRKKDDSEGSDNNTTKRGANSI